MSLATARFEGALNNHHLDSSRRFGGEKNPAAENVSAIWGETADFAVNWPFNPYCVRGSYLQLVRAPGPNESAEHAVMICSQDCPGQCLSKCVVVGYIQVQARPQFSRYIRKVFDRAETVGFHFIQLPL
jgi:hypothetical protein